MNIHEEVGVLLIVFLSLHIGNHFQTIISSHLVNHFFRIPIDCSVQHFEHVKSIVFDSSQFNCIFNILQTGGATLPHINNLLECIDITGRDGIFKMSRIPVSESVAKIVVN
jgi:hypothetical protein